MLELKYFVLNPTSDEEMHAIASRLAMRTYAHAIEKFDPELACDLFNWIEDIIREESK